MGDQGRLCCLEVAKNGVLMGWWTVVICLPQLQTHNPFLIVHEQIV